MYQPSVAPEELLHAYPDVRPMNVTEICNHLELMEKFGIVEKIRHITSDLGWISAQHDFGTELSNFIDIVGAMEHRIETSKNDLLGTLSTSNYGKFESGSKAFERAVRMVEDAQLINRLGYKPEDPSKINDITINSGFRGIFHTTETNRSIAIRSLLSTVMLYDTAKNVLERSGLEPGQIDFVVYTSSLDTYPHTARDVMKLLGIPDSVKVLNSMYGCNTIPHTLPKIFGINQEAMIDSNSNILFLSADDLTMGGAGMDIFQDSSKLNGFGPYKFDESGQIRFGPYNSLAAMLFSCGNAAWVIPANHSLEFSNFSEHTFDWSAEKSPVTAIKTWTNWEPKGYLENDVRNIYDINNQTTNFDPGMSTGGTTSRTLFMANKVIDEALKKSNFDLSKIDLFICHHASQAVNSAIGKALIEHGANPENIPFFDLYGNPSAPSILHAFERVFTQLQSGQNIAFVGAGYGNTGGIVLGRVK